MIFYRPTDGDPHAVPLLFRPQACFLMTQLGGKVPADVVEIRKVLESRFKAAGIVCIDASSVITGRDFLLKIWELIVSVPIGVAIIHQEMESKTIGNIFYELGLMQAYGKETLVVTTPRAAIPSDFVRTEYIEYSTGFEERLDRFLVSLQERADYYVQMSAQLENNPLLAIDFLRRAFLLTRNKDLKQKAVELFDGAGLSSRAKSSVETLLINSFRER